MSTSGGRCKNLTDRRSMRSGQGTRRDSLAESASSCHGQCVARHVWRKGSTRALETRRCCRRSGDARDPQKLDHHVLQRIGLGDLERANELAERETELAVLLNWEVRTEKTLVAVLDRRTGWKGSSAGRLVRRTAIACGGNSAERLLA